MDAYETRRKDWEDLEVTKEELNTLTECLKKEEFRKLLIEYAEEVTDPENRKLYEKEITQLEKERGVDVTFVNPEPGYVIKTSVNGNRKCFLNIGKSDIVARPSSQPSYEQGHRGLQWSIPYTLIPPRDDLDKKNVRCMVFDVVFHPDTIYLASKNARFREIVNNTAMDGVESNFQVKLDRKNLRFPKMNYKGVSQPSVIRKPSEQPAKEQLDLEPEIYQKLMADYDRKREQRAKRLDEKPQRVPPPTVYYQDKPEANQDSNNNYATPKFSIKHQSDIELQDFSTSRDAKMNATVPKRLVVNVDLPLLKTASDASLDVQEHFLSIKSEKPAKYLLDLPLPYRVDPDNGNAKFDPKYKKLVVTLPVIPPTASVSDAREDSGVDSDHESPIPLFDVDSVDDCSEQSPPRDSSNELVEKCETVFASPKIEEGSERVGSYGDTALRTSNTETTDAFTNPSIKYSLPAFTCNIYDNQLAITVNVKNVDPNSIRHRILQNNLGIHVTLTSVGAGFYPQHYSFCLKIYKDSVQPESLVIEPWDNNIVFTVALKNTEYLARYYVGIDEEFMEEKDFPTATTFKNQLKELTEMDDGDLDKDQTVEVQTEDDGVVISISSNQCDSDDEDNREDSKQSTKSTQRRQSRRHAKPKARSVSESSGDELSISESSADENGMPMSSIDCNYDSVQEFNSESDCSSLKKTVRFNDVVSRQLFRSNSSILGQRKKNQRKLRNKKRAHDRRMSESENSETEERDKYKTVAKSAEASETMKPILNREKQSAQPKTANIEIKKGENDNRTMVKRKANVDVETLNEIHGDNSTGTAKDTVKAEFKNDLIFDLDM
ncbi:PIH1 domain-containing protein Nop17-like isoform X2 [Megalopta genalis]|uniref:PIH1 domain-containing protein Nop17-like isoform X2 n=1 Tax=Megalopta genalis TaxID=115081 RepID=UPI003FD2AD88